VFSQMFYVLFVAVKMNLFRVAVVQFVYEEFNISNLYVLIM